MHFVRVCTILLRHPDSAATGAEQSKYELFNSSIRVVVAVVVGFSLLALLGILIYRRRELGSRRAPDPSDGKRSAARQQPPPLAHIVPRQLPSLTKVTNTIISHGAIDQMQRFRNPNLMEKVGRDAQQSGRARDAAPVNQQKSCIRRIQSSDGLLDI